jgi:tRNA (adenine-N(1)-)-methyltransferase non-catalytic subunit
MDTLSQMLTFTNIRPGSNVLVCDDTAGLVGSAILERMGGDGKVYFFHDGQSPNLEIVRYCNFSQKIIDSYVPWPWHRFQSEPTFRT